MKTLFASALLIAAGAAAGASANPAQRSCATTAGPQRAAEIVRHCTAISESGSPPCHAANSCDMMIEEIRKWCGLRQQARIPRPEYCSRYR